jgi:PhnB protein
MSHSAPIPHLVVSDGEAAIAFYAKAFGAICEGTHLTEDGRRVMYGHLNVGGGTIYLNDDFPEFGDQSARAPTRLGGASCVIHLEVPDADVAWERAIKAGAQVVMPLDNQFWGARYGQLKDPFGHLWSVGGPMK